MQYRPFRHTGLNLSVLALVGSSLGFAFREIDEAGGLLAVHNANDHGVNLFDTAAFPRSA